MYIWKMSPDYGRLISHGENMDYHSIVIRRKNMGQQIN